MTRFASLMLVVAASLGALAAAPSANVAVATPVAFDAPPLAHRAQDWRRPCHDGRYSDGRPHTCEELLEWLDRGAEDERRDRVHPCSDGRYSDGRPRSCRELLEWLARGRRDAPQ